MGAVPVDVDTDTQPPMSVPLRHFLVGLGLLVAALGLGLLHAVGAAPGVAGLAHVHLLLAGWVCVTIMGAMTQFVPVWSGTTLHSLRLATAQLWLVGGGLAGFVLALLAGRLASLSLPGAAMLLGFWTFVYNVGRSLPPVRGWDVTERHFATALGFFVLVTMLGLLLAVDLAVDLVDPIVDALGVRGAVGQAPGIDAAGAGAVGSTRERLRGAHATLAVFGAVLTTVIGALYQLGTMFTQTDMHGVDHHLRRFEEVAYAPGVLALAGGRLLGHDLLGRVGGALTAAALLAVAVVLARRLVESRVPWTPMLRRYAVAAPALAVWAAIALVHWTASTPLGRAVTFGRPGTVHLLVLGAVGAIVLGTLYHVVPFVIWVHRYSDRLGREPVPMIDDLYDDRVAFADLAAYAGGTALVVIADLLGTPATTVAVGSGSGGLPTSLALLGGGLVALGATLASANLLLVVHRHGPAPIRGVLFGDSGSHHGT